MPLPNILEFIGTNISQRKFQEAQEKLLNYLGIEVPTNTELSSAISNVNDAIAVKVDKVYLDTALSSFQNGAIKTYPTLSAANADIANIALNTKVSVLSETEGGDYYKATADATSLTKSPYDRLRTVNALSGILTKTPALTVDLYAAATVAGYIGITGVLQSSSGWSSTDFISVQQGDAVVVNTQGHGSVASVALYDANKAFISGYISSTSDIAYNVGFTVNSATKFIRVSYHNTSAFAKNGTLSRAAVYHDLVTQDEVDVPGGVASRSSLLTNDGYINNQAPYSAWDKKGFYSLDGVTYTADASWSSITKQTIKAGQKITASIYGGGIGADASGIWFFPIGGGSAIRTAGTGATVLATYEYTPLVDGTFIVASLNSGGGLPSTASLQYSVTKTGVYTPFSYASVVDQISSLVNYWEGKKIVWVGTSIPAITSGSGYSYPKLIEQLLGCTMVNNAVGESFITYNAANPNVLGAASYKTLSATIQEIKTFYGAMYPALTDAQLTAYAESASYEKLIIGTSADLIVFDHMHNDLDKSYITLGNLDNNTDRSTFYGAFNHIIEKLYLDNPYVRLAFVSPPNRFVRLNGAYTLAKFDTYRDALKNLALKYNAMFIDLAVLSNVNQNNYPLWTYGNEGGQITPEQAAGGQGAAGSTDLIHPSSAARVRYANMLAENIRSIS